MKAAHPLFAAVLAILATGSAAAPNSSGCRIAKITNDRELHDFLSLRAVAIVRFAQSGDGEKLSQLIEPSALFNLGIGDVGGPLGAGPQGAKALAKAMGADTYRFLGWDYMEGTTEPCSSQKVTVEFVNTSEKRLSQVEFTFVNGRLTVASGWERSFQSGSLNLTPLVK